MADETGFPSEDEAQEEVDPGAPNALLAGLEQTPAVEFLAGVRRRIHRRSLVADASDFSWFGLSFIALAFLTMFFQLFQSSSRTEGDR